jgi:hypothetical protein
MKVGESLLLINHLYMYEPFKDYRYKIICKDQASTIKVSTRKERKGYEEGTGSVQYITFEFLKPGECNIVLTSSQFEKGTCVTVQTEKVYDIQIKET